MIIQILFKLLIASIIVALMYSNAQALNNQEKKLRTSWESLFQDIYTIRKTNFEKNSAFKSEFNQSRYNVVESPVYCKQSDSYKMVHPDVVLEDMYVWRDYAKTNLPKRITLESTFAVFDSLPTIKNAGLKYENSFPLQMSFIYTTVSSLYNNYHWGRGLGCNFQKYSHIPGKASMSSKNQLIDNFMQYMSLFEIKKIKNPECKRNASFIPDTYRLNDKEDCLNFFGQFNTSDYQKMFKKYGPQFIMKTNQHRGEGITVLFKQEEQDLIKQYDNGNKCGIITKQIVGQKYISNPFLYKGHKIEFRIYFSIVSTKPMIAYAYSKALIKRCASPFSVHSLDRAAHVCNTAIVKTMIKEDSDDIEDEEFFIDWYLEGLEDLLIASNRAKKGWLQNYLYPKIHRALIHMMKATQHSFGKDSTFSEFFAVDFLLDDNLDVWVLEVNYNPQILSVTPERVKRNFKMLEDHFELHFQYIRSKMRRIQKFMKKYQKKANSDYLKHEFEILDILDDKLEPEFEISPDNLYVKIMDEGLDFPQAYNNLIQKECQV